MQCTATHCTTLHHNTTHKLQHNKKRRMSEMRFCNCNILQYNAMHCNTLLQYTAMHCNAHCNTLQQTSIQEHRKMRRCICTCLFFAKTDAYVNALSVSLSLALALSLSLSLFRSFSLWHIHARKDKSLFLVNANAYVHALSESVLIATVQDVV